MQDTDKMIVNTRPRVLAVRGGALGDFILTLPSLLALCDAGYDVELLTRPAYGRLAQDAGLIMGWRPLDSPQAALLTVRGAQVGPEWREWLSSFDAVVSWLPDADGAFQEQLLQCGVNVFYQGDWRCAGSSPAALQLAEAVSFSRIWVSPVQNLFSGKPALENPSINQIAFHPGSGSPRKNWPLEHWIKVMRWLAEGNPEVCWLVVTGEVEEQTLPGICSKLDRAGLRWESAHALDLTTLAHRLRQCRVLLGHDSGIGHLAAACGVACRLLFGPTDPAVWAPLGQHVEVLRAGNLQQLTPDAVMDWLVTRPVCGLPPTERSVIAGSPPAGCG